MMAVTPWLMFYPAGVSGTVHGQRGRGSGIVSVELLSVRCSFMSVMYYYRLNLCYRVRNEGEFWMSFDDFAKQFSHLDLVHIGPDDWMSEPALHRSVHFGLQTFTFVICEL